MFLNKDISSRQFFFLDFAVILFFCCLPLLFSFPYRINLFLAWEGAYRLSMGQIPYKDFGLPMGFVFWIIPALFFKIFGPFVFTLIKAQVFINIISLVSFRSVLKLLGVRQGIIFLSILVLCLSYLPRNFWPWYNHTVFVFELLGLNFLLLAIFNSNLKKIISFLALGAFFMVLSFFTKQDTGALGIIFGLVVVIYNGIIEKNYKYPAFYLAFVGIFMAIFILPFLPYGFGYWFNYGQPPHYSRVNIMDFLDEILGKSEWIKFYLLMIVLIIISKADNFQAYISDKKQVLFALLTVGIIAQAALIQVTSYTPIEGNIYFHSFAFAFIFSYFSLGIKYEQIKVVVIAVVLIGFWWLGIYWIRNIRGKVKPMLAKTEYPEVISKNTFIVDSATVANDEFNRSKWVLSNYKSFHNIYLPEETVKGMDYLKNLEIFNNPDEVRVLNMSELTPLTYEFGFPLESGPEHPLWYHKGVGLFDKQVGDFCEKIANKEYDLVLFETIPELNNFYPYEVQDCLKKYYRLDTLFLAPRIPETSYIEVYLKK